MDKVSIHELLKIGSEQDINLVDIREHYLYERGSLAGAINIPYSLLKRMPDKYLLKEEVYYLFCESGIKSEELKNLLNQRGYHVISVKEGYLDFNKN